VTTVVIVKFILVTTVVIVKFILVTTVVIVNLVVCPHNGKVKLCCVVLTRTLILDMCKHNGSYLYFDSWFGNKYGNIIYKTAK
jgi:hypothetical protein